MGDLKINLSNTITVMLIGFLGVWVINRGLSKAGLTQWQA
jgi:hypothetical protein